MGAVHSPRPSRQKRQRRRRAQSASRPRTSQDRRNKMGAFDRNGWWIEFHYKTSDPLLGRRNSSSVGLLATWQGKFSSRGGEFVPFPVSHRSPSHGNSQLNPPFLPTGTSTTTSPSHPTITPKIEFPVRNRRPPKHAKCSFFGQFFKKKSAAEVARTEVGAEAGAEVRGRRAEAARR